MNTSFVGSRSSCPANQSRRCFRTSERRCSSACAVFFKSDLVAIEEPPDHGGGETFAAIGDQPLLDFQQRHVRLAANEAEQIIAMGLDAARAAIPARRRRRNLSLGFEARHPSHGAGDTDPETLGRRVARHPAFHHRPHNAFAKIVRKRHNRRLLRADAAILNQNKTDSDDIDRIQSRSDAALAKPKNRTRSAASIAVKSGASMPFAIDLARSKSTATRRHCCGRRLSGQFRAHGHYSRNDRRFGLAAHIIARIRGAHWRACAPRSRFVGP